MQNEIPGPVFKVNPAIKLNLNIKSEVRDNGAWKPLESSIYFNNNPEFCKFIIDTILNKKNDTNFSDLPEKQLRYLIQTGILIKEPDNPTGNEFKCIISENNNLIPNENNLFEIRKNIADYIINPQIFIQENEEIPLSLIERIPFSKFTTKNYPVIWIEDPKTKIIMPYWFPVDKMDMVHGLITRKISITDLTDTLLQRLVQANFFVPQYYLSEDFNEELEKIFQKIKQTLIVKGYVILKDIINPLQIGALRKYLRYLEKMDVVSKDERLWERDLIHDEPVANFIHHQLNYFINKFVPQKVRPTYCVLAIYKPGSVLLKHKDRKQQDWNLSLSLDMESVNGKPESWPIFLETGDAVQEIKLGLGDGVLYRGTELTHWRNKLPENQKQTVCLFHFVEEHFQ